MEEIAEKGAVARPLRCALLDERGVYLRMVDTPEVLTPLHVIEVTECDLPPGRYRWNPAAQNMVPLPPETPAQQFMDASPLDALFEGLVVQRAGGAMFSERTLAWMDWYVQSVDYRERLRVWQPALDYYRDRGLQNAP